MKIVMAFASIIIGSAIIGWTLHDIYYVYQTSKSIDEAIEKWNKVGESFNVAEDTEKDS